jgi:hypothetical protein
MMFFPNAASFHVLSISMTIDPLPSIDVSPSLSALAMSRESVQVQPTGFDWFL